MRGKLQQSVGTSFVFGITPADAGKTRKASPSTHQWTDHPRGCGENQDVSATSRKTAGSPPRMRGKLLLPVQPDRTARITPADAGKTRLQRQLFAELRDHPRGCGENLPSATGTATILGSPPRMRGKPLKKAIESGENRITPADAGKTKSLAGGVRRTRDHPRGCGENFPADSPVKPCTGSPPRMRGKQ